MYFNFLFLHFLSPSFSLGLVMMPCACPFLLLSLSFLAPSSPLPPCVPDFVPVSISCSLSPPSHNVCVVVWTVVRSLRALDSLGVWRVRGSTTDVGFLTTFLGKQMGSIDSPRTLIMPSSHTHTTHTTTHRLSGKSSEKVRTPFWATAKRRKNGRTCAGNR